MTYALHPARERLLASDYGGESGGFLEDGLPLAHVYLHCPPWRGRPISNVLVLVVRLIHVVTAM